MESKEFQMAFVCRESREDREGLAPIELVVTTGGKRITVSLGVKHYPEVFAKVSKSKKGNEITALIDGVKTRVRNAATDCINYGKPITREVISEAALDNGDCAEYTVAKMCDEFSEPLRKRVGSTISDCAYDKYIKVFDAMYRKLGKTRPVDEILFKDLQVMYEELNNELMPSTSAGYMTKVKAIFKYAFDNGRIHSNPASQIKIHKGQPNIEFLTEKELERIRLLHVGERLSKVRDLCLFQAYGGGLSFCDMMNFDLSKVTQVGDMYLYSGKRQKTGIDFSTVILPQAIDILQKYNWKLPEISNQKFNSFLKEIQELAGINKTLHSHLFRKTYATMLINRDVPLSTVSKCLGHSNSVITGRIYAHTSDNTVLNQVAKAFKLS